MFIFRSGFYLPVWYAGGCMLSSLTTPWIIQCYQWRCSVGMKLCILFVWCWTVWPFDLQLLYRPSNGGKYCIGERKRYRICETDDCPENTPGFLQVNIKYTTGYVTHTSSLHHNNHPFLISIFSPSFRLGLRMLVIFQIYILKKTSKGMHMTLSIYM